MEELFGYSIGRSTLVPRWLQGTFLGTILRDTVNLKFKEMEA
jgi:hypothetical protein